MPGYFFDTSALAKVYRKEIGSDLIDRLLAEPASSHIISRLAIVEMESVFALKVRTEEIDQSSASIARRRLQPILAGAVFWWPPPTTNTFESPDTCSSNMGWSKHSAHSMRCNFQSRLGSSELDLWGFSLRRIRNFAEWPHSKGSP